MQRIPKKIWVKAARESSPVIHPTKGLIYHRNAVEIIDGPWARRQIEANDLIVCDMPGIASAPAPEKPKPPKLRKKKIMENNVGDLPAETGDLTPTKEEE